MVNPGDIFGRLTAIEPLKDGKFWRCQCDCGKETKASKWHLRHGKRKSCGCRLQQPPESYTCVSCNIEKPRAEFYLRKNGRLFHRMCKECKKAEVRTKSKERHRQLRLAALIHYGGDPPSCECCGENTIEFLHLDHAKGDGHEHRKQLGSLNLFRWLKQNDYPAINLRVLCANCNMAIGAYGYCPHASSQSSSDKPRHSQNQTAPRPQT
jgi:hypothetical protein